MIGLSVRYIILVVTVMLAGSASGQPFSQGVDASWSLRRADGMCLLEQPVRDFGTVRFVGVPGEPLRLEVLGHRDVFANGGVDVYQVAPPWSPAFPDEQKLGSATQRTGSMLLIADPLATQVLMALYKGYEAHVEHAAWYGGKADIRIGNEHLRPQYDAFAQCLRSATAAGWSAFERTRIEYGSKDSGLSDADRQRLRRVAEYVLADPAVAEVYVDGHTDDVGTPRSNLVLSKRRAQTVADFLAKCGVSRDLLVVRYHGDQYPVARGEDDEARAANRRTTVRLERNRSGDVATR